MTAWFRSHRPFWNRLSAAVVHTLMLRMLATSLISSELNSPALSVNSLRHSKTCSHPTSHHFINPIRWAFSRQKYRHRATGKHVNHVQNPLIAPLLRIHTYILIESRCHRQCNNLSTWCFLVHFTQLERCINIIQIIQEFNFPSSSIFHQNNQFHLSWMGDFPVKFR